MRVQQKNLFEWSWKDKEDFTSFTGGDTPGRVGCMSQGIVCDVFVTQKTLACGNHRQMTRKRPE